MAQVVGVATGQPWIGSAYGAAKSAVNGDIGNAVLNGAKAGAGAGWFGDKAADWANGVPSGSTGTSNVPNTTMNDGSSWAPSQQVNLNDDPWANSYQRWKRG